MTIGDVIRQGRNDATRFVRDFAAARRGNVAMIFAIVLPVLVMITMGGVDISRATTVRINLQDALDAAALAAARSTATTDADLTAIGLRTLNSNLQNYPDIKVTSATFKLSNNRIVIADASVDVKTLVANIVLPPYGKLLDDYLPVGAHSEVNRASKNIEVGLVLDITGSMLGQRLTDLKSAANQLVDIVVKAQQTPYYTRMAIIPYSIGVNVGGYANAARGTPVGTKAITGAAWTTGSQKSITSISSANPALITSNSHGFADGDYIWISGFTTTSTSSSTKMTTLNDKAYRVVLKSANTLTLKNASTGADISTLNYSGNYAGGIMRKCLASDCSVVITAPNHGVVAGSNVYITGVGGMTQINGGYYAAGNVTTNTYSIGVNGANYGSYSSGGASQCGADGCQLRVFRNAGNEAFTAFPFSTCVSERTGAQAYTDASPATYKVGTNYPAPATGSAGTSAYVSNPCPSATIQPLTSNTTTLKNLINGLTVTGSTAGQIGLAWGWYSVSPNFNTLWSSNPAGAYNTGDTLKSVILMTDGDFNSPYCTGVLAADAGSGSGDSRDHVNCDATNGDPFEQATKLCDAMKAQSIIVYTVGFQVAAGTQSAQILKDCATGPAYAFLPASGADLTSDFAAIGRDITRLRISK